MNESHDPKLEMLKQGSGFTKDREETMAELVEEIRPGIERKIRAPTRPSARTNGRQSPGHPCANDHDCQERPAGL